MFERAIAALRVLGEFDNPRLLRSRFSWGANLRKLGRFSEARAVLEEALALARAKLDAGHLRIAEARGRARPPRPRRGRIRRPPSAPASGSPPPRRSLRRRPPAPPSPATSPRRGPSSRRAPDVADETRRRFEPMTRSYRCRSDSPASDRRRALALSDERRSSQGARRQARGRGDVRDLPRVRRRPRRHRGLLAPLRAVDLRPRRRLRARRPESDRRPARTASSRRARRGGRIRWRCRSSSSSAATEPRSAVRGVDMLDGSPIVDLKPYLSNVPPEKLRRGWLDVAEAAAKSPG